MTNLTAIFYNTASFYHPNEAQKLYSNPRNVQKEEKNLFPNLREVRRNKDLHSFPRYFKKHTTTIFIECPLHIIH
jgi:hypothetical protein